VNEKVKTACIAIDVSKGHSHYQGFLSIEKPVGKAKRVTHTIVGFDTIRELGEQISESYNDIIYIFEATGVYHRGLSQYFDEHNQSYIILNPLEASKVRKSKLRAVKTDKRDCASIAKAYFMNDYMTTFRQDTKLIGLQRLHRYYIAIIEELRKLKNRYRGQLDIVYPLFDKLYSTPYQDIPMAIVKKYPHPSLLKKSREKTIVNYLEKNTRHRAPTCEKETRILIEYAQVTQSGCGVEDADTRILKQLQKVLSIKLEEIKECFKEMESIAKETHFYHQLLSIPGVGEVLAVRLLAELGDLDRFNHHGQLVAYAGIDPTVYQSGTMTGEHFSITKKGNKNLRALLYLAVTMNLRSTKENSIRNFYTKKRQQTKPLVHNAAVIACANKLIRIIFALYRSGEYYHY
jgi:transposase